MEQDRAGTMPWPLARCHGTGARAESKTTSPAGAGDKVPAMDQGAIPQSQMLCQGSWAEFSLQSHMSGVWGLALLAHSCSRPQTKVVSCLEQQDVCGSRREHGTALPPQQPPSCCPRSRGAQRQATALGTGSGCAGALLPSPLHPGQSGSSPVLVVDVVPKARGVDDCQLHANPLLLNL